MMKMTQDTPRAAGNDTRTDAGGGPRRTAGDGPRNAADDPRTGPPGDPLGDEIAELCAHLDAGQFRLLTLLHRYDEEELWSGWRSCAHWLAWRVGLTIGPARERVRVARCSSSSTPSPPAQTRTRTRAGPGPETRPGRS